MAIFTIQTEASFENWVQSSSIDELETGFKQLKEFLSGEITPEYRLNMDRRARRIWDRIEILKLRNEVDAVKESETMHKSAVISWESAMLRLLGTDELRDVEIIIQAMLEKYAKQKEDLVEVKFGGDSYGPVFTYSDIFPFSSSDDVIRLLAPLVASTYFNGGSIEITLVGDSDNSLLAVLSHAAEKFREEQQK